MRQRGVAALAQELVAATSPEQIQALAARVLEAGRELEALARAVEADHANAVASGTTVVVLTDGQRARILAQTGVAMETVTLPDPAGTMARTMPATDAQVIEAYALREAERQRASDEAHRRLRAELDAMLPRLEAHTGASPELAAQLRAIRERPPGK